MAKNRQQKAQPSEHRKPAKPISEVYREEYLDGLDAYGRGVAQDENPYPSLGGASGERQAWLNGWLDAWRIEKYGE